MDKLKKVIVGNIERFFYWYGLMIAKNPWRFLIGCLVFVAISSLGLLVFKQEKNPMKLWIPQNSDFSRDTSWMMDKFKEGYRMQYLLVRAPNVLEPHVLEEVERIRKKVTSLTQQNTTWEDICFRIPAAKSDTIGLTDIFGRKKRSFFFLPKSDGENVAGLPFDPSLYMSSRSYCSLVNRLPRLCLEVNLLQLWNNDDYRISRLSLNDVIYALNRTKISPVYGHPTSYPDLLGGIERDSRGKIVSAKALLSVWLTHVNFSEINIDETGNVAGTGDWVSAPALAWEKGYLELMKEEEEAHRGTNMSVYYEAGRSYGDLSSESMFQDVGKLFIGSVIMFCFVQFALPTRFNWVELRFGLGCVGLLCVFLSFIVAVSLCSLMGIPYGPVHTSLPFLLLGIGVDDMFVIASCWKNLPPSEKKLKLEEQIAVILSHAGVSITITSVTDLVAFFVGSFTILPSLQSFCIYTAVGIFMMFVFQATMFVAFLCIDEKRIAQRRNSVLWCIEHKNFTRKEVVEESLQSKVFDALYRNFFFKIPIKILVIGVTATLAGFAIKGNLDIKQKFDPKWFLPNNSYLLQFFNQRNLYYPDVGRDAAVFIGQVNYSREIVNIHTLALTLENETNILKDIDYWTSGFIMYAWKDARVDLLAEEVTDEKFREYLSRFIWSPNGARYQKNFRFDGELKCGEPTPPIVMSSFNLILRNFDGPEQHIPAMNRLKQILKNSNVTSGDGFLTVWSKVFANWVTDEVIDRELYRNLGMALTCVMICTAILIVDLQICFWIFMCVLLTLIDVAGFIYFWGLYIDVASCIAMVLAVGLCVDFAAHIGHIFLTIDGSRQERALKTVKYIGTATFNGAFSTFLAVSLLGSSDAYIFQTFFKIFFLVVLFGIFHGIVFLPVVLSIIGPKPYAHRLKKKRIPKMTMSKDATNGAECAEMLNKPKPDAQVFINR